MSRVRAADDFEAIRLRLDELGRERRQRYGGEPVAEKPIQEPDPPRTCRVTSSDGTWRMPADRRRADRKPDYFGPSVT